MAEPTRTANDPNLQKSEPNPRAVAPAPPRWKYRLRFRKVGDLRLVSHHDLMHVFERMARRAALPIAHTQGFHPQPRLVFALSLALGIAGGNEVLQLELTESVSPEKLHADLARQAPSGLEILSVRRLEGESSSLVRRAFYRLPLGCAAADYSQADAASLDDRSLTVAAPSVGDNRCQAVADPTVDRAAPVLPRPPEDLPARCLQLLAQSHLFIQRERPRPRTLDIRPYLSELRVENGNLEMAVWVTPEGTARPEEYARHLGLELLLEAGAFFERTGLEMMDETPAPVPATALRGEESLQGEEYTALPRTQERNS